MYYENVCIKQIVHIVNIMIEANVQRHQSAQQHSSIVYHFDQYAF